MADVEGMGDKVEAALKAANNKIKFDKPEDVLQKLNERNRSSSYLGTNAQFTPEQQDAIKEAIMKADENKGGLQAIKDVTFSTARDGKMTIIEIKGEVFSDVDKGKLMEAMKGAADKLKDVRVSGASVQEQAEQAAKGYHQAMANMDSSRSTGTQGAAGQEPPKPARSGLVR